MLLRAERHFGTVASAGSCITAIPPQRSDRPEPGGSVVKRAVSTTTIHVRRNCWRRNETADRSPAGPGFRAGRGAAAHDPHAAADGGPGRHIDAPGEMVSPLSASAAGKGRLVRAARPTGWWPRHAGPRRPRRANPPEGPAPDAVEHQPPGRGADHDDVAMLAMVPLPSEPKRHFSRIGSCRHTEGTVTSMTSCIPAEAGISRRRLHGPLRRLQCVAPGNKESIGSPVPESQAGKQEVGMTLTDQQVRQFETEGWLFLPDAFSAEEIAALRDRGRCHLPHRPQGDLAREVRRATHRLRRAHL